MKEHFFISYSRAEAGDFALKLADELASGPPAIPVFLDRRDLRPGEQWDEQLAEAIRTCKGMLFVMTPDSVHPESVCKNEWVRALNYKRPVLPLLLHPDAELPFRLGSREYIDFTGSFDSAVARLRKHLAWLDSPEGVLQALKYRLSDAQRAAARAEPEQQARIQDEIADLGRQIAQQQNVVDHPQAAEQRVQQTIDAGLQKERTPAPQATAGPSRARFVNPPPVVAPAWFQDRSVETNQIGEFLKDGALRLMTVVGRGGMGKSALVCRLLQRLEGGELPDDGGPLPVDGIVYLSHKRSFHRLTVPDLYAGLASLLGEEAFKQVDAVYRNPQATTRATMEVLTQFFARGRTIVLLDNFEDTLDPESAVIKDSDLDEALRALLELPAHGLKIIMTTRLAPRELAAVEPARQRRLELDAGLEHPYAENILRAMDVDGKLGLRDAPAALLAEARERTLGFPRALEHLFGILSADRNTSLQEILTNTSGLLPEKVVEVLVGEAFSRLDPMAQRVMQALAVYRYPVPPAAVDHLLQPYVAGVNSTPVLGRLVNMQFARRDAGRYYLNGVDGDHALSRLAPGAAADRAAETPPLTRFALRHRAAEWFKLARKPPESIRSLDDLAAQLSEFDLRCQGEDYDTAANLLFTFNSELFLWGHYRLATDLHQRLHGHIADPDLAAYSVGNLANAYFRMGQLQLAKTFDEEALRIAQQHRLPSETVWRGNLAGTLFELGHNAEAAKYLHENLPLRRAATDRQGEGHDTANLAQTYYEVGQIATAVEHYRAALMMAREAIDREGEALQLSNLTECHIELGDWAEARRLSDQTLKLATDMGYRFCMASVRASSGVIAMAEGNWTKAAADLDEAIEVADEIANAQWQKISRERAAGLALYRNDLVRARELADAARKYDLPIANYNASALGGVIALRQQDRDAAVEAFTTAVRQASEMLALTPDRYGALDALALSYCGLALCGDRPKIADARSAYRSARAAAPHPGIVHAVLRLFDALAQADTEGILAEVRPFAAGTASD